MNPLFEELLAAQAPGYTPPMPVAPTAASTGGAVAQPLTPAGQVIGGGILHGLMFPGEVAKGNAQVFDDQGHVTKEATDWGAERALGMLRTANIPRTPVGPHEVAFGSGPIRAYHGSPHDFDRFDLSKIGTGEGNQAYGHGLYFAENKAVADAYKGVQGRSSVDPAANVASKVLASSGEDAAIHRLKSIWPNMSDERVAAALATARNPPAGRMYEVAIHADPERFLDWDKPLTAQPHAASVLQDIGVPISQEYPRLSNKIGGAPIPDTHHLDGAEAYHHLTRQLAEKAGDPFGRMPERATQILNEAGIPGIKYLDQGSRTAGDGSRNYVTFSDKIVEIMRKYGVASFAALPPAVQMMLQRGQTETPASNGGLGGLGGLAPRA